MTIVAGMTRQQCSVGGSALVAKDHLAFADDDFVDVLKERLAEQRDVRSLDDNGLGGILVQSLGLDVVDSDVLASDETARALAEQLILGGIEFDSDLPGVILGQCDFARPRI